MRACISFAIQDTKRNFYCQASFIAKKYFNFEYTCTRKSKRKLCIVCHKYFFGHLHNDMKNDNREYFIDNFQCTNKYRPCYRIGKPYCRIHTCHTCPKQIDMINIILCLKQFSLPKDVLRYVVYPMIKLVKFDSHYADRRSAILMINYISQRFLSVVNCPYNLYKCLECTNVVNGKYFEYPRGRCYFCNYKFINSLY